VVYNGVAAIYALCFAFINKFINRKSIHIISLIAGGLGLISIYFISDPKLLILSMVGVGMAWASILAMPYAMLADAIPKGKMGIYMGIFNFFIVSPQILNGLIGGPIVSSVYGGYAIYSLVAAGVCLIIGGLATTLVKDDNGALDLASGGGGH